MEEPFCYTSVFGQERAKKMVRRALAAGRLPHAFLFRGPAGVGKKLFARGLAAALNCRNGGPETACGECSSCHKLKSGNHPDFLVIEPEKDAIKIDQVREMSRAITYPPYESAYRVVVLRDVHAMQAAAANSLLKTLEEPPPGNILILTAETSREVLPTILSRCQIIPFLPLADAETFALLRRLLPDIDEETARLLARFSDGSPGRALIIHEHGLIDLLRRLFSALAASAGSASGAVLALLPLAEEISEQKENLPLFLELLRAALAAPLLRGNERWLPGLPQVNFSSQDIFIRLRRIDAALRQLARNCGRTLVLEVLLFHLAPVFDP
jgi:DNA polymerase-3 subunit delta'